MMHPRPRAVMAALAAVAVVAVGALPAQDPASFEARAEYLFRRLDQGSLPTPMMAAMLKDPYPDTRLLAVRVIAASADPSQALLLTEYLNDPDFRVRYQVMLAAGRLGPAGRDLALRGLGDPIARVRQAAAWAATHGGDEALQALSRRLAVETDVGVKATATANLWRFGDAGWEPLAVAAAGDDDPQMRRAAAYSLARSGRPAARTAIRGLAADPLAVIRATAVAGLGEGPLTPPDVAVLAAALDDPDPRVATAACAALAAQPKPPLGDEAAAAAARLWQASQPQLAVAALDAAAVRPEIGGDDRLAAMARSAEPWPATRALVALARRGAAPAAEIAAGWFPGGELWQRRAVAAAAFALGPGVEKAVAADGDAAVRLAWLESLDGDLARGRVEALRAVVAGDPDPAVRSQALDLLGEADAAPGFEELLRLAGSWRSDEMPDARATALAAALEAAADDDQRTRVLEIAGADRNPAVAIMVTNAARDLGIPARSPERELRHDHQWYLELVAWMWERHWLDVVTDRGTFRIRLDEMEAPLSTREIFDLAAAGFYDGLTFHRVVPDFVVQGGDPRGDGWGGPGFTLPDEAAFRPFDAWRVGIATAGPNTGGSQLFVTLMPADKLVGHYTNLGEVVAGREVLTRLQVGDAIRRVETFSGAEPAPFAPTLLGELGWGELAGIPGWAEGYAGYQPDPAALEVLRGAAGRFRVVAVLGTWCGDSEREVPRLVRVLDDLGGDAFDLLLVGVDRTRRIDDDALAATAGVERTVALVPTIVVLDDAGLELGRVVETADKPIEQLLVEFLAPVEGW